MNTQTFLSKVKRVYKEKQNYTIPTVEQLLREKILAASRSGYKNLHISILTSYEANAVLEAAQNICKEPGFTYIETRRPYYHAIISWEF